MPAGAMSGRSRPPPAGAAMTADRPAARDPASPSSPPADAAARPGLGTRVARIGGDRGTRLISRAESSLPVRCLRRFAAINGRDRALVLGGQAFTTVIPLVIVVAATVSRKDPTALADRVSARFHVSGASAQAVRTLFERPPGATGTITVAGMAVLVFSLLSFVRSLQRTYEVAWDLPSVGVRGTLNGMTALGVLIA